MSNKKEPSPMQPQPWHSRPFLTIAIDVYSRAIVESRIDNALQQDEDEETQSDNDESYTSDA